VKPVVSMSHLEDLNVGIEYEKELYYRMEILRSEMEQLYTDVERLTAECDRLRDALKNLIEAADHVGSSIYDWERMLPQYIEEGFAALQGDGK